MWGYDTLSHKIPILMGFNFPRIQSADLFSLEFEWYGCPYPMNLANAVNWASDAYPIPANVRFACLMVYQ